MELNDISESNSIKYFLKLKQIVNSHITEARAAEDDYQMRSPKSSHDIAKEDSRYSIHTGLKSSAQHLMETSYKTISKYERELSPQMSYVCESEQQSTVNEDYEAEQKG